jgi:hypothetical protein
MRNAAYQRKATAQGIASFIAREEFYRPAAGRPDPSPPRKKKSENHEQLSFDWLADRPLSDVFDY